MADMKNALAQLGVSVEEDTAKELEAYLALLIEWNGKMDLTSVKDDQMIERHFADSLKPLSLEAFFPKDGTLIDVGTGAGFPGLPIAIARKDMRVTLLEAQGKRCQFLKAVVEALQLSNVFVVNDRAENLGRKEDHREQYDAAVARAVAPLNILAEYLLPFVKTGGHALCWKGPAAEEERLDGDAAARKLGGKLLAEIPVSLPGVDRVLVPIFKNEKINPQYPRKNGIPAKRPLKADKT